MCFINYTKQKCKDTGVVGTVESADGHLGEGREEAAAMA